MVLLLSRVSLKLLATLCSVSIAKNANAFPASPLDDPSSIIPKDFYVKTDPYPGKTLPIQNFFEPAIGLLGHLASKDYDEAYPRGYSCFGEVMANVKAVKGKESESSIKFLLWGTFRCIEAVTAAQSKKEGRYSPAVCEFGPTADNIVATATFSRDVPIDPTGAGDYCVNAHNIPALTPLLQTPANTSDDPIPSTLISRATSPPSANSSTDLLQRVCGYNIDTREFAGANVGSARGSHNESVVSFTILEAILELAGAQPRPAGQIEDPWKFEYTSAVQGYTLSVDTPSDEKRPFNYYQVADCLSALGGQISSPANFELTVTTFPLDPTEHFEKQVILDGKIRKVGEVDTTL